MIFRKHKKDSLNVKLSIDGELINEVDKTKFLGVLIDNKLTWKQHIAYVSDKIACGIGMIIKARQYLDKQGLISLYNSFIYPYLTYCNHIWGSTYKTSLKRLTTLQNKAVKIISHARWRASCDTIYKHLNIMKLAHINTYLIGRFMFRISIGKVPESLTSLLKTSDYHSYSARIANLYHAPCVKLDLSKTGIKYRGTSIWNLIALEEINLEVLEAVFKKNLIRMLNSGIF